MSFPCYYKHNLITWTKRVYDKRKLDLPKSIQFSDFSIKKFRSHLISPRIKLLIIDTERMSSPFDHFFHTHHSQLPDFLLKYLVICVISVNVFENIF